MPILHVHSPEAIIAEPEGGPCLSSDEHLAAMAYRNATLDILEPGFQGLITPDFWDHTGDPTDIKAVRLNVAKRADVAYLAVYQYVDLTETTPTLASIDKVPLQQIFLPIDGEFLSLKLTVPWKTQRQIGALVLYRTAPRADRLERAFSSPERRQELIGNICPNIATLLK